MSANAWSPSRWPSEVSLTRACSKPCDRCRARLSSVREWRNLPTKTPRSPSRQARLFRAVHCRADDRGRPDQARRPRPRCRHRLGLRGGGSKPIGRQGFQRQRHRSRARIVQASCLEQRRRKYRQKEWVPDLRSRKLPELATRLINSMPRSASPSSARAQPSKICASAFLSGMPTSSHNSIQDPNFPSISERLAIRDFSRLRYRCGLGLTIGLVEPGMGVCCGCCALARRADNVRYLKRLVA